MIYYSISVQKVLTNLTISFIKPAIIMNNEQERVELMKQFHNDKLYGGHAGRNRLYAQLRSNYYWENMAKNVASSVRNCKSVN